MRLITKTGMKSRSKEREQEVRNTGLRPGSEEREQEAVSESRKRRAAVGW